jgi:hypothetical protein
VSAFGLVRRAGLDPVADRLLANLVRYAAGAQVAELHPLIDSRIVWGDYASERGVVPEGYSGLLLNTEPEVPDALAAEYPVKVNAEGFHIAGGPGGWNSKPSIQYVARGRRPFGPYSYTLGGSVQPEKGTSDGRGDVAFRIPGGRTALRTTVENPTDSALTITATVNGVDAQSTIAPHGTAVVENEIPPGTTSIRLGFRGDRRLILVDTDFR